jgi:hypothetical protein
MSVLLKDGLIVLAGDCGVEEVETLVGLIQGNPGVRVDVGKAGVVHTALWQVLLALAPDVTGEPRDPFIRRWIAPRLG